MKPLMVEIIAHAATQFYHCMHCEVVWNATEMPNVQKWHRDTLETSLPANMLQEYRNLSDWVINAAEHYGGKVVFKVVDAASVEGVWKSLRYGARRYPAVVIEGKLAASDADFGQVGAMIDQRLAFQPS